MKNPTTALALIAAAALCFCVGVASIVILVIFAPEGTDIAAILAQVFTGLAALGAAAGAILTRSKVERVGKTVDYLANGGSDAKNRTSLVDVIKPEYLREDYLTEQAGADYAHRDNGPTA